MNKRHLELASIPSSLSGASGPLTSKISYRTLAEAGLLLLILVTT